MMLTVWSTYAPLPTQAIESLRTELSSLEQRVETADSSLQQSTHEMAEIRIQIAGAESAWKGLKGGGGR